MEFKVFYWNIVYNVVHVISSICLISSWVLAYRPQFLLYFELIKIRIGAQEPSKVQSELLA